VLPEYMVPAEVLFLPRFPLTPNGKLDTRLLPEPASSQGGQEQRDRQTFIKPRDAIEARLYDIWTELLRLSRVSVLDNFFELGGNSLIAVRLMSRIQQHFGQDLPLTMLFKYPTIEGLATILRRQSQPQEGQNILVPLQPQGSLLPFFCVHPAGGTVFSYQALARHLGADRPFYGLQSPDTEASGATGASLEELATYYVAAIQNAQPHGPYHLGGWSLGGVIAFEIAQQLLQAGEEVAFLALLDSSVPISFYRQNGAEATTPVAGAREEIGDGELAAAMIAEGTVAQPGEEFAQLSSREKLTYVWEQARANHSIPHDTSFEQFRRISRMQYTNIRAVGRYIPRSYPGRITLFRSSESLQAPDCLYDEMTARRLQPDGGWDELTTDQVEVHIVPGSHHDMVDEPHVRVLAEVLKGCLETSRKNL
jgi:thioesterase domain-containing protein/acyl carrier protein